LVERRMVQNSEGVRRGWHLKFPYRSDELMIMILNKKSIAKMDFFHTLRIPITSRRVR
jgi:hypothetical protein